MDRETLENTTQENHKDQNSDRKCKAEPSIFYQFCDLVGWEHNFEDDSGADRCGLLTPPGANALSGYSSHVSNLLPYKIHSPWYDSSY